MYVHNYIDSSYMCIIDSPRDVQFSSVYLTEGVIRIPLIQTIQFKLLTISLMKLSYLYNSREQVNISIALSSWDGHGTSDRLDPLGNRPGRVQ